MTNFESVQSYMRDQRIDAWLVYDFRGNNPVLAQLLPGHRWTTRRAALFVPSSGEPVLLNHGIDDPSFKSVTIRRERYLTWQDLRNWLARAVAGRNRVAMEYAPGCTLPVVSIVDAGTIEMVRSLGVEVVSSANLIQICVARWSPEAQANHANASCQVAGIKDEAFDLIRKKHAARQPVTEYDVQQFIMQRFAAAGLETPDPPICAVNAHSGDPHYEPTAAASSPINPNDWVLIDLWARRPGNENIFSDITWVGFAGREVPAHHRRVFDAVKRARDAALESAVAAFREKRPLQGWQLDDAARREIIRAGFEHGIRHRTGHSLSAGEKVHGIGVNLDNLETHDTRDVLPGLGFTIEPGIYLPEFGVRLEINVFVDPQKGPVTTSSIQNDIVLIA